jgi:hypothetical protein
MKTLWMFVTVMVLCSGVFAQKADVVSFTGSGNAFLRDCSAAEKEATTQAELAASIGCTMFVAGVVRGVEFGSGVTRVKAKQTTLPQEFCRPDDTENGQLVRIVLKFIRENPEKANEETALLVMYAMRNAFPCPAK